jgi:hypothetical protein
MDEWLEGEIERACWPAVMISDVWVLVGREDSTQSVAETGGGMLR